MKYGGVWLASGILIIGLTSLLKNRFVNPVIGTITSKFGNRTISGKTQFHNGVDIQVAVGTPVKSPAAGIVIGTYNADPGGVQLIIDHGAFRSGYAHLSKVAVSGGQKVRKSQIIANTGNTGVSTGPHLHFTWSKNNQAVDPLSYFSFK